MREPRFTWSRTIRVFKEVESGRKVAEVGREYDISDGTYYNWKAKYGYGSVGNKATEGVG